MNKISRRRNKSERRRKQKRKNKITKNQPPKHSIGSVLVLIVSKALGLPKVLSKVLLVPVGRFPLIHGQINNGGGQLMGEGKDNFLVQSAHQQGVFDGKIRAEITGREFIGEDPAFRWFLQQSNTLVDVGHQFRTKQGIGSLLAILSNGN